MQGTFNAAYKFNRPLDTWSVSKVQNFDMTFKGTELFNQDLGNWDVSAATTLEQMFSACCFGSDPPHSGAKRSAHTRASLTPPRARRVRMYKDTPSLCP